MDRVSDFLAMGGYARYIWPAFAVTALVLVGLLVQSLAAHRSRRRELERLQSQRGGR